jgi:tRNA pseudouridine55 synthase
MNGAIIINKESGMTSRDVVNKLNKILKTKEIGHIGTLDPMATGVLVCLIGKYTKLTDILTNHDKEYIASFKLGILTDTLDISGSILKEENKTISRDKIVKVLNSFVGTYNQEVPLYSAVKINGKKLYEYARNNQEVKLPSRDVTIKSIKLISIDDNIVTIKTEVSKGTYIRSLIKDIGEKLGTYATMVSLERTRLGNFKLEEAATLQDIIENKYHLYKIDEILDCKTEEIKEENLNQIKNGNVINKEGIEYLLLTYNKQNIALYKRLNDKQMKPLIMF